MGYIFFAAIQGGNKRQFERLDLSKIFEKVSFSVQVMDNYIYVCRLWSSEKSIKSPFWSDKAKVWLDIKKKQQQEKTRKNQNWKIFKTIYIYVHPFRVHNKGPSYYVCDIYSWIKICDEIDFYLLFSERNNLFDLKNVQTLCPTTVRLLSDMSKFWLLSVQWATVICSPVSVTFSPLLCSDRYVRFCQWKNVELNINVSCETGSILCY